MATKKNQSTKAPVTKPSKAKVEVTDLEFAGRYATRNYVHVNERAFYAKQMRENTETRTRCWIWYALKPDGEMVNFGTCYSKGELIETEAMVGSVLYPRA